MPYQRKYGVATANGTHIVIPILIAGEQNFSIGSDWTPAAGDVKVTKDDGAPANIATLPTYVTSQGWEFQFAAAELQCKKLDILIVDQTATKEIEDQFFSVETYGHASAMVPIDFSDIVRMGLTALPNAAADAAGGLPISDAGALDIDTLLGYLTAAVATAAELAKVPKSDGTSTWNATALASINAEVDTALTSLNDIAASDILGTALTESYGAQGATRTLTQLLYEIKSMLTNHAISGTTWTTKKLDGTTTAKTYTLNDDDEPSSCVEAS